MGSLGLLHTYDVNANASANGSDVYTYNANARKNTRELAQRKCKCRYKEWKICVAPVHTCFSFRSHLHLRRTCEPGLVYKSFCRKHDLFLSCLKILSLRCSARVNYSILKDFVSAVEVFFPRKRSFLCKKTSWNKAKSKIEYYRESCFESERGCHTRDIIRWSLRS